MPQNPVHSTAQRSLGPGVWLSLTAGNGALARNALLAAFLGALSLLAVFKGYTGNVHGRNYWHIGYQVAFIRRGLVGTIFSPLLNRLPNGTAAQVNNVFGLTVLFVALALLIFLAIAIYRRIPASDTASRTAWVAVTAIAIGAPAIATYSTHNGMLDIFLLMVSLLALIAFVSNFAAAVVALSLTGALIHEAFLFVWLPLLIPLGLRNPRRAILAASVTLAATLLMVFGTNRNFDIPPLPFLSSEDLKLLRLMYGQTTQDSVAKMLREWTTLPLNVFISFVYYLAPVAVAAAFALFIIARIPGRSPMTSVPWASTRILAGTGLSSSVLLMASDTSRFLTWAEMVGFMLAGLEVWNALTLREPMIERHPQTRNVVLPHAVSAVGVTFAIVLLTSPLVDCWFHVCFTQFHLPKHLMSEKLGAAYLDGVVFFNRYFPTQMTPGWNDMACHTTGPPAPCAFDLGAGENLYASPTMPPIPIRAGKYSIAIIMTTLPDCAKGPIRVSPAINGRVLKTEVFDPGPKTASLDVDLEARELLRSEFNLAIAPIQGCTHIDAVRMKYEGR
jgi:hypothetical protein